MLCVDIGCCALDDIINMMCVLCVVRGVRGGIVVGCCAALLSCVYVFDVSVGML